MRSSSLRICMLTADWGSPHHVGSACGHCRCRPPPGGSEQVAVERCCHVAAIRNADDRHGCNSFVTCQGRRKDGPVAIPSEVLAMPVSGRQQQPVRSSSPPLRRPLRAGGCGFARTQWAGEPPRRPTFWQTPLSRHLSPRMRGRPAPTVTQSGISLDALRQLPSRIGIQSHCDTRTSREVLRKRRPRGSASGSFCAMAWR